MGGGGRAHTHTPVPLHEPWGCLRLGRGNPVGFHPAAAECDPTLSALRPEHGQPRINQRQGQCHSPLQTLSHTQTHPLAAHTHTRATRMGRFPAISPHRRSIKCLVHACCSHVTLTDSRMNDLFGGGFQLSEMDGINRGFLLADESGGLPL